MDLVRKLYERMQLAWKIYRALAIVAVLAASALTARLVIVNRRITAIRSGAADVFYQLKALELEVARIPADAPQREELRRRRASLEELYDDWLRRFGETNNGRLDDQAIRAAVVRLGEAGVLVSQDFIGDVRKRIVEWSRTPDYARAIRAAADSGYSARIDSVLAAANLPADLKWVAFQESRFRPRAVGPPTRFGIAKGMWQLIPATARQYGLRLGPLVGQPKYDPRDQRHDVPRSTGAAVRYMNDLYLLDAQGSGLLVMACYNAGQTRVLRLLRSLPATPRDRNFWRLLEQHRKQIPDETYGYVVGIVAASALAAEPTAFHVARLAGPP
jgi:soluble lytic murein transglycosylase-like protein